MSMMTYTAPNGSPQPSRSQKSSAPKILSREDQETLTMVQDWHKDCRRLRLGYERQWYLNLSFFFGKQWLQWSNTVADAALSRLYEPPVPPWRVRLVSNKVRAYIRKETAKLLKEKPQPFVIPATSDDDDLAAARAGEAIYEHITRTLQYDRKLRRTIFWTVICGSSFMKDWFDPQLADDEGIPGSIQLEPVNPFQLYVPNPAEVEIEHQPYVIHELAKDPYWVEEIYGVTCEPEAASASNQLEQRIMNLMGAGTTPQKYVVVKECWIKPCKKFPEGAVITWAGDKLLSKGIDPEDSKAKPSWPFAYRDFPFTKFDHIPTGAFYGSSAIVDLIPLQKEYNRTRSQIVEAKNRMAKPQLVAAKGSIDANKVTSEPGLVIWYTPGFQPPQPIPLVNLPGYVIEELQRCTGDMDDIVGQHEISKGHAPTGVSAATAISFLQEQDDSMISQTTTEVEEGTARVGRHLLSHVNQFWEAERTVRVLGENNTWEVFQFTKSSINGNTDLNIMAGSAMPRSQAAKQAFIMELIEKKIITPERGLRYLQMSETSRMYEEIQVSARQAQRENMRMAQGDLSVTVNTYDEHDIHVAEHDLYRRRQAFERLPDELKAAFEQHVQTHKQMVAQSMGQMIMPGQELPPSPPGGGGGPGASQPPGAPPLPPGGGSAIAQMGGEQ